MAEQGTNFLVIISDDHGYGDFSALSSEAGVATPHLDRLREGATTFSRAYVTAPICSPSRAGLIAGKHQGRWGATWFDSSCFPPPEVIPGPRSLQELGWRTAYFGKVHYGPDAPGSPGCPDQHGFDTSLYGLAALSMGRLHYMTHSRAQADDHPGSARCHGTNPLYDNGVETDSDTHTSELFADRAIDFIDEVTRESGDPYFCMVAFNAVHNFTWQLPEEELTARGLPAHPDFDDDVDEYLDWYDGAIAPNLSHGREYYLAQLELMDRHIGRILDAVDESGQADRTVVVYLTDNGGSRCNFGDNTPLEGSKYTLFEGGIRTPMIVRWPGVGEPGTVNDSLVSSLDLVPSFLAAASDGAADLSDYDGQDLQPVLRGESAGHSALYFDLGAQQAVVRPDVKWRRLTEDSAGMREALLQVEHTDVGEGESLVRFVDGLASEALVPEIHQSDLTLCAELRDDFERWQATLSIG